ncbi:hypothetical protein ABZ957_33965 [Streptomyces sp. NPDC046316]|uniref:hypothetical protein n=1 Tax=Streptomyces sp. NPDC046316 TaxID=3154494 RepID=UPI0033C3DB00
MADRPLTAAPPYDHPWVLRSAHPDDGVRSAHPDGVRSPHPDGVRQPRASDVQETSVGEAARLTGRGELPCAFETEPYRTLALCRSPLPGGTGPAAHPGCGS